MEMIYNNRFFDYYYQKLAIELVEFLQLLYSCYIHVLIRIGRIMTL